MIDRWSKNGESRWEAWNSALPFSVRHGKAMSMNEFRSHLVSKIFVVVMNICFAQLTYLITHGSGALNTISCEVLWTGRGESWADNHALSENQSMGVWTGRANIFICVNCRTAVFRIHASTCEACREYSQRVSFEEEWSTLPMAANLLITSCDQQRCCLVRSWFATLSRNASALVTIALRYRDWLLDRSCVFLLSSQTIAKFC